MVPPYSLVSIDRTDEAEVDSVSFRVAATSIAKRRARHHLS